MSLASFKGLYTAIITPFKGRELDINAFKVLITRQIEAKVDGIVIAGSTGEIPNLSNSEYKELLKVATEVNKKQIKIIAGVGYNSTVKTIEAAQIAEEYGVDGVLAVTPYYNKPTQEGLFKHYKELHDNSNLPIILYSTVSRTGVDLSDNLIFRLADLPKIIAYKDSSGDIERPLRISALIGNKLDLLAGDDSDILAYNANGGVGCISVAGNIIPKKMKEIVDLTLNGEFKAALREQQKLIHLYKALFIETNPIPVKYALNLLGLCEPELRLPLCGLSDNNKQIIRDVMKQLNLI